MTPPIRMTRHSPTRPPGISPPASKARLASQATDSQHQYHQPTRKPPTLHQQNATTSDSLRSSNPTEVPFNPRHPACQFCQTRFFRPPLPFHHRDVGLESRDPNRPAAVCSAVDANVRGGGWASLPRPIDFDSRMPGTSCPDFASDRATKIPHHRKGQVTPVSVATRPISAGRKLRCLQRCSGPKVACSFPLAGPRRSLNARPQRVTDCEANHCSSPTPSVPIRRPLNRRPVSNSPKAIPPFGTAPFAAQRFASVAMDHSCGGPSPTWNNILFKWDGNQLLPEDFAVGKRPQMDRA